MKTSDKNRAILAEQIARSWKDSAFRGELKAAPKKTLLAAGMDIPADMDVVILENTSSTLYAVLPTIADQEKYRAMLDKAVQRIADLPENLELRVVRDTPHKSHIVIPAAPAGVAMGKLSDEDLEQVAGGKSHVSTHTDAYTNEAAMAESSAVQTAEAVTTTVEAQDVATTSTAAAEVEVVVVPCFIS